MTDLLAQAAAASAAAPVPNRLSPSTARYLLPPHCPAKFRWEIDQPEQVKPVFDFGRLVHKLVLGESTDDIAPMDPHIHGLGRDGKLGDNPRATANWKRNEQMFRNEGLIPVHIDDYTKARVMAEQVHVHPQAGAIFADGNPEYTLEVEDPKTGVVLKGIVDWMTMIGGSVTVVDYKSAQSAHPSVFARKAIDYGYLLQGAWYRKLLQLLEIEVNPDVLFVVQEKEPPHLCSVIRFDAEAMGLGERQMRQAIDTFAWCRARDEWPAYGLDIETVSLPGWAFRTQPQGD